MPSRKLSEAIRLCALVLWATAALGGRNAGAQRAAPPTWTAPSAAGEAPPESLLGPVDLVRDHGEWLEPVGEGLDPLPVEPGTERHWLREPVRERSPRDQPWTWRLLPSSLIYRSYLANTHEPRFAGVWNYDRELGWMWDIALGGRVGIIRYGTPDSILPPDGWELDLEGAVFPRLDIEEKSDLVATDYRFGLPLTYGSGRWQTKLAWYHLSSHLGDEYMLKNPDVERINYSRNVWVLGESFYYTPNLRLYAEAGYGYYAAGGSEPWEFQFGADYSPARVGGAPFAAFNGHLREEVDYGGSFVVQWGWQWRGPGAGHLFRIGGQYFNGKSEQFEFLDLSEQKVGFGLWYDY